MARALIRAAACLAPASRRARWREEWLAEIEARAAHPDSRRAIVRPALGAPIDAWLSRRTRPVTASPRQPLARLSTVLPGRTDWLMAWRQMRRAPVINAAAVLALAVGIGLTLTAFTIVRGVFYLPLPGPDGSDLYRISDYDRAGGFGLDVDLHEFERRRRAVTTIAALGAYNERPVTIGAVDRSHVVVGAFVTTNTFRLLGVSPIAGRDFVDDDAQPGGAEVVLVRETLAVREFGSVTGALGATLPVDGKPRRIVGIVPANCGFPFISHLWIPFGTTIPDGPAPEQSLRMFGRLAPSATTRMASGEMQALLLSGPPRPSPEQLAVFVVPFGRPPGPPEQQLIAWAVIAVFVLLLAVAAATVAHLMLARALARRHELAVCTALGASRLRLIVQLITEALALGALAAALGTLMASGSLGWLQRTIPDLPYWVTFEIGVEAALVVVGLTMFATVIAGVLPAIRATGRRAALTATARTSTVRFGWIGSALIATELAVAVGFLTAAVSLGRGLIGIGSHSYSLPMNEVAVSQLYYGAPPESQRPDYVKLPEDERRAIWRAYNTRATAAQRHLVAQLLEQPGVRGVALGSHFPGNEAPLTQVAIDRYPDVNQAARVVEVGPGFFSLLNGRQLAGRDFTARELETRAPVAVVNEPFARRHYGNSSQAVGRHIQIIEDGARGAARQIVGVVPDLGVSPAAPSRSDGVYVPLSETTVVRVGVRRLPDPRVVSAAIHQVARALEPQAVVQWTDTLTDQMAEPVLVYRGLGGAVTAMGGVALLLACTGIHALVAFSVAQRRREIAVRVALGASRTSVTRTVLTRTIWQLAIGIVFGGTIAMLLDEHVQRPFDLERTGFGVLAGVLVILIAAAFAACIVPLRRALSFGPADTLRES